MSPPDVTPALANTLERNSGVLNLLIIPGVARNPAGDSVQFDVINAAANRVLADLRELGLAERGSIVIDDAGAELSDRVAEAEARAPRRAQSRASLGAGRGPDPTGGRYPPSWFVLLAIAGLIAAVGIFTNSQILVVGAMVVGPEYAAIISVALGIEHRDRRRVRVGTGTLVIGFRDRDYR